MKYYFTAALLFFAVMITRAQSASQPGKIFWKESFSTNKLPEGWINVDVNKKGCEWLVTNEPYPGSFEYQQQAPPIASASRGYHLQYQAGYIVDEDQPSWDKKHEYPNAYVQTKALDCRGHNSVVLSFQHTFRYNQYHAEAGAGLTVGVSTDSIHWTDYNVQHQLPAATDMFQPLKENINISAIAAGKPKVYIRFYWKGYFSWYWMVDDISLSEAYANNVGIVRLVSHNESGNTFKQNDALVIRIKNTGSKPATKDLTLKATIDKGTTLTATAALSKDPLAPGAERDITFAGTDLSKLPMHKLHFAIDNEDEDLKDNTLDVKISASETALKNLTGITQEGNAFVLSSDVSKIKVIFYRDDIFRIWMAPTGEFTDPAGDDIVNGLPEKTPAITRTDKGAYVLLQSKLCALRIYKTPLRFAMYDQKNANVVWEETAPLLFGAQTIQTLSRKPDEYFYGCGMQNGYFSHRDQEIRIEKGGGWDDGGRANPAPFYMSTAGYGVLRNTFDIGKYSFKDTVRLSHQENRFDAFYFYGPSLKAILNDYTDISGKPFLIPRWALSMGDANCYNKPGRDKQPQTTPVVLSKVADQYIANDMPRGWILPNDGYGCGYVQLDSVVKGLHERGFYTGLWTENGVAKIAQEVGTLGTRLCKLDVAWVGPGYKYALDACKAAYNGIEQNSDARGFVWSVMGWAGTQRYSTVWSGDQKGNWEYIRFHIPTFTGAGLSAQNAASSDIDGIFGGSDSTYVRDLQWKCFIPTLMTMSGWAKKDKQPWVYGEPYTSINRQYLQLKMRFTPYMYTLCYDAYKTGVPATRAMVLEFPKDSVTWGKQTQYQFMNGEWLLVAPVFRPDAARDSIYLPKGQWTDYWDGKVYEGGQWLRHYDAPLSKLPLFVKEGAILPMYPQMNFDAEKPADTLTLDIYPKGHTTFDLYEDDGLTREHRAGVFATTLLEVNESKDIAVAVHAAKGKYKGMYTKRNYVLQVHTGKAPAQVSLNGKALRAYTSESAWKAAGSGFYFNALDKQGILHIKTASLSTAADQQFLIKK